MTGSTTKSAYLRGLRDSAPFIIVIAPFALLFGVVATEAGLSVAQTMGFNVLVIAGASQFIAVSLMNDGAPLVIVLVTALAVNLRMAMYSASLAVHLGAAPLWQRALVAYLNVDNTYATSIVEYERRPAMTVAQKVAYFFGTATPIVPPWYALALVGIYVGASIPPSFALDFALPIAFIAIVAPSLKSLAHVTAALVSVIVALLLAFLPSGLGLLIAAGCAMLAGAAVETWQERRG